jgi:hypothetical protein
MPGRITIGDIPEPPESLKQSAFLPMDPEGEIGKVPNPETRLVTPDFGWG